MLINGGEQILTNPYPLQRDASIVPLGITVNVSSLAIALRNKFCLGAARISPPASNLSFSDVYLTPADTLMRSARSIEAFFDDGD